jgi:hypothetical protein
MCEHDDCAGAPQTDEMCSIEVVGKYCVEEKLR